MRQSGNRHNYFYRINLNIPKTFSIFMHILLFKIRTLFTLHRYPSGLSLQSLCPKSIFGQFYAKRRLKSLHIASRCAEVRISPHRPTVPDQLNRAEPTNPIDSTDEPGPTSLTNPTQLTHRPNCHDPTIPT